MKNLVLLLAVVALNVCGQLIIKQAMISGGEIRLEASTIVQTVIRLFTTPMVILGLALYAIGAVLWMVVLSNMELSTAYPMTSLSYVFLAILAYFLFHEKITLAKGIGTGVICLGVIILSRA